MTDTANIISALDAFKKGTKDFVEKYNEFFSEELDQDDGGFPEYKGQLFFFGHSPDVEHLEKDARALRPLYLNAALEAAQASDMPQALQQVSALADEVNEFLIPVSVDFRIA